MGPNGSGKSTLAQVLAGNPAYEVTGGSATFNGKDLLALPPEERAQAGVFLAFQYPVEIPGVSQRVLPALGVQRDPRRRAARRRSIRSSFSTTWKRSSSSSTWTSRCSAARVNMGFSGGEKKRNEILQMAVLEPRLALLDETDSGLDIDALRIVAERRERAQAPRQRDDRRHALSAAAQLHRPRLRARARARAHREVGRQEPRARARGEGLRLARRAAGRRWRDQLPYARRTSRRSRATAGARSRRGCARRAATGSSASPTLGFPTPRNEDWHFTSVAPIAEAVFSPLRGASGRSRAQALEPFTFGQRDWPCMVFVNGRYDASLSTPARSPTGVRALDLATALRERARSSSSHGSARSRRSTDRSFTRAQHRLHGRRRRGAHRGRTRGRARRCT